MKKFKLATSKFKKITPKINSNIKYINNVNEDKYNSGHPVNRYWTFDFIETISNYIDFNTIKTILDVGSRDGYQSVEFRNWFPNAKIVAFEANPNQIRQCISVTNGHKIEIVPKAAGEINGKTKFNLCANNVGGSSLLKITNHPRSSSWTQTEIEVDMVRIDDWSKENNINSIDLLWMDVQGAETIVLNGCGDILNNVKAICTEVGLAPMYHNSTLKNNLDEYLSKKGFIDVAIFHLGNKEINSLDELLNTEGECDVVYINKKYVK